MELLRPNIASFSVVLLWFNVRARAKPGSGSPSSTPPHRLRPDQATFGGSLWGGNRNGPFWRHFSSKTLPLFGVVPFGPEMPRETCLDNFRTACGSSAVPKEPDMPHSMPIQSQELDVPEVWTLASHHSLRIEPLHIATSPGIRSCPPTSSVSTTRQWEHSLPCQRQYLECVKSGNS